MGIFPQNAARNFIGDGFAYHCRPSVNQHLHGPGRTRGRCVGGLPVRVAPASDVAGHVEDILGGKRQASKRSMRCPSKVRIGIVQKACKWSSSLCRVVVMASPSISGYAGEQLDCLGDGLHAARVLQG